MPEDMPPLYPTPNLSRLLGPEERIIHTAKLHPFHGFPWLLAAFACVALAYAVWPWFALAALVPAVIYWLPFHNHEVAVTTHRVLVRHGRFSVHTDAIEPEHLDHYQFHQHTIPGLFHCGNIVLNLQAGRHHMRELPLPHMWHPMTFLEAVTTLSPKFRGKIGE